MLVTKAGQEMEPKDPDEILFFWYSIFPAPLHNENTFSSFSSTLDSFSF